MQSPSQSNSQTNPVTTATTEKELDTEPAQKELGAQEEESKTDSAAETEAAVTPQGNGTLAETPAGMVGTDQPLTQPSDQTDRMELGSDLKPSAAVNPVDENPDGRVGQKLKNQPKVVRDGRRYVPSKKAMVDPLKMDMSKPAGIPLTCEYFTSSIHHLWLKRLNVKINFYKFQPSTQMSEFSFSIYLFALSKHLSFMQTSPLLCGTH